MNQDSNNISGKKCLGYGYVLKVELKGFNDGLDVVYRRKGVKDGSKVLVGPNSNDGVFIY